MRLDVERHCGIPLLSPPHTVPPLVLLQEVDRYNHLLLRIKRTLVDLQKGVKGLVVITTDL